MAFIEKPSSPPSPCRLAHHNVGHSVVWTEGLDRRTGIVLGHRAAQRWITIRRPDGSAVSMPCGGVAAAELAVAR